MQTDAIILYWNLNNIAALRQNIYRVYTPYRMGNNTVFQGLRIMCKKINIPGYKLWYRSVVKDYNGTIIIFDSMMDKELLIKVKEDNSNAHLIFWYWNTIRPNMIQPDEVKKIGYDVWSFNINDCEKYHLKLNHTYFCTEHYKNIMINSNPEYDLVYIGRDKGRLEKIYDLLKSKEMKNMKLYMHIVADHVWQRFKKREYKRTITHEKALKLQMKGKAILELVPEGSAGLTVRMMDALYLGQKIITDNSIVKTMDFYRPENIFIINEKNPLTLKEFLNCPYIKVPDEIVNKYSFEEWMMRFINNNSMR